MNTKRRAHCQLWHDWKERIIRIGDEQTSLQNQFDNIRNEFIDNSPRIEALEAGVNALDGRLIIAETDIADAEDRITACENDIDRIDAELVDKTGEINALANRMSLAEADIDDIDARLEGIEAGDILLSQLVPDADKDMAGKALNNVKINANEVRINGTNIDRTRQNEILLYDMQTEIESGTLNISNPNYTIVTESDLEAPYSKVVETNAPFGAIAYPWGDYIPVTPGERIHIEGWIKPIQISDGSYGHFPVLVGRYDKDKKPIGEFNGRAGRYYTYNIRELNKWHKIDATVPIPTSHTPYEGSDGGPVRYIRILYGVNPPTYPNKDTVRICGIKYYREAKYISDIQAKVATFDGVVIADGGTVDGVDISTHTHDGSAIGGQKISYNNLVDKPTIPRPPMPFKKSVSINLASPGDYIDVIPGTKYGRTALTLERLQYRSIANILEGTGAFVVIGLIYDDNTVGTAIDRVTINGDTDWHPPTYYGLNQTYQFTKNYIKGIRIERTPGEGPPITGYVDIIGYLY